MIQYHPPLLPAVQYSDQLLQLGNGSGETKRGERFRNRSEEVSGKADTEFNEKLIFPSQVTTTSSALKVSPQAGLGCTKARLRAMDT